MLENSSISSCHTASNETNPSTSHHERVRAANHTHRSDSQRPFAELISLISTPFARGKSDAKPLCTHRSNECLVAIHCSQLHRIRPSHGGRRRSGVCSATRNWRQGPVANRGLAGFDAGHAKYYMPSTLPRCTNTC